jgi:hypothetical protein
VSTQLLESKPQSADQTHDVAPEALAPVLDGFLASPGTRS